MYLLAAFLSLLELYCKRVDELLSVALHVEGASAPKTLCLCRFQSTFLGSKAVAGQLGGILAMKDATGLTIRDALEQNGYSTLEDSLQSMRLPVGKVGRLDEVRPHLGDTRAIPCLPFYLLSQPSICGGAGCVF